MKLPKIQTPVYKTKLILNDEEIIFRPFLVKEEKILLTSIQTQDKDVIIENYMQVLKNCVLTENINVETLPSFDAINLFVELRKKSMGETINISVNDSEVKKYFDAELDLNEIKILKENQKSNKIQLNEEIGIILKYPTIKEVLILSLNDENELNSNMITEILIKCIDKIYDKENVYDVQNYSKEEILEFVDQMSTSMVKSISEFFENMPKLVFEKEFISPFTNKPIKVKIENFMDFLI